MGPNTDALRRQTMAREIFAAYKEMASTNLALIDLFYTAIDRLGEMERYASAVASLREMFDVRRERMSRAAALDTTDTDQITLQEAAEFIGDAIHTANVLGEALGKPVGTNVHMLISSSSFRAGYIAACEHLLEREEASAAVGTEMPYPDVAQA